MSHRIEHVSVVAWTKDVFKVDFYLFQSKQQLELIQQELKQEKQAKQEAEVTISQLELEIKKLKADLHVRRHLSYRFITVYMYTL